MKKLLINSFSCHLIGLCVVTLYLLSLTSERSFIPNTIVNSICLVNLAYLLTAIALPQISKYVFLERKYYILPLLAVAYSIIIASIVMLRIDYSRTFLIQGFLVSFVWLYTTTYIRKNAKKLCLYAIPNFDLEPLKKHKNINLFVVDENSQLSEIKHGLVVDLHHNITAEQEKFIADCSINNIRVFHSESIREIVEGKVQTQHLSENSIGTLQPNPIYFHVKRIWESILIIASLPITLPIMFITAILIKIENPGPAMFYQERVGQGGKVFKIYKFRSMTVRHKDAKSKFATEEQARVTRIGKVIRKVRIDELPQFLNVLKGEMALIGPRPEQQSFVKQFEQEIPFYGYRHMVKPGITGWAQTVQGYTDDVDSTREKLAHDLYYIKHLSIWLDINIVFKTIKTMMTGFGAK
ncbi:MULTISPECIES: sugar transferase [Vibrio]|uniref:sugar transferase n=1 Tax=Vibrio TaxID=662 RepID=UPI0018D55034|nr:MULTISPECIES: sugar transferase [Vibrio]